ncbi:S-type pyocin domain-containing protein [Pseudomonas sp. LB3P38]|uniref:S-type pyocin domain-containing protein n=1 Tax=Pseudomonas lyxosi TaxID=3398358 RepID=UPI0039EEE059
MQKPPTPPNQHQPRPVYQIDTPVVTIGVAPDHMIPAPRTSNDNRAGPFGHGVGAYNQNMTKVQKTTKALEQEYQIKASQLPESIEAELAATRLQGPTNPLPPSQSLVRELGVLNKLTQQKTAEFHSKTVTANAFYGGDPFNRHINEFMKKATTIKKWPGPDGIAMQALVQSLRAAHDAKLLSQTIQSLNQRTVNAQNLLRVVQANEEAQRAAAELARINEEAAVRAREQARLAATENARRAAAERARVVAETAAQQVAAERARLQAQAKAKWEAEWERFRVQREVDTQALMKKFAEFQRQVRVEKQQKTEKEAQGPRDSPTFANTGTTAVFGPVFTGATGTSGINPTTSLTLRSALRTAVSTATAVLSTATAPVLVGFATLLAPSRLGNADLFSVSVPLSELAPVPTTDLNKLAAAGGAINLPLTLGSKTMGNRVEILVATTDGVTVPTSVPVRLAHFDVRKNVYVSGSTVSNGPVITWTPLVEPQNPSTEFPLIDADLPIYEGATVTPNTGRIDPFPELDCYGFGGFITVFPIDSEIPPTFTMFRDRRQDPGVVSGGGQSVSGSWLGAASTLGGAPIPKQIADKLRGREFSSFNSFRRAFWRAVANDQFLIDQFTSFNKSDIRYGLSPSAHSSEQVGGRKKFEIHHINPISEGGSVYDIDNLRVLTPKQHIETHSKKGEI